MKRDKKNIYLLSFIFVILGISTYFLYTNNKALIENSEYQIGVNEINKSDSEEIIENEEEIIENDKIKLVGTVREKNEEDYTVALDFSTDKCIKNIYDITEGTTNPESIFNEETETGLEVVVNRELVKNKKYKYEIEMASGYRMQKEFELVSAELKIGQPVKNSDGTWGFPEFEIVNPCGELIKCIILQFASGIQNGDRLSLSGVPGATVTNSGTLISINTEGISTEVVQQAIRTNFSVTLSARSSDSSVDIKTSIADEAPDRVLNYCASTGHYYEYVPSGAIPWTTAKVQAENRTYFGMHGYLATITSREEQEFSGSLITGYGWLGGTCDFNYIFDSNGNRIYNNINESLWNWYWVTGPEAGTKFYDRTGALNAYSAWKAGEPNNSGSEYYLHMYSSTTWNDFANGNASITGYIVEYGGMPNDEFSMEESYSDVVTINIQV